MNNMVSLSYLAEFFEYKSSSLLCSWLDSVVTDKGHPTWGSFNRIIGVIL